MKYLERFDLFSGEYENIKRSDFVKNLSSVGKDLSEEQRVKLSKLFDTESVGINSPSVKLSHDECFFYQSVGGVHFFIYPFDDEWYFIEVYNSVSETGEYYKCDGIKGIEKMLSDKDEVFREI